MHTEAKLVGEIRKSLGSLTSRRLRRSGRIPGNLYGHKQAPVPFSITAESFAPVVRGAVKVVDIELDGKTDKAIVRELQWDTFGTQVQHIDLVRIDPDERLQIEVPIELRGTAPGLLGGGVLEYGVRALRIECLAHMIPDHIAVKVGELQMNQAIHVKDLECPPGMVFIDDPETVIVRVVHLQAAELGEGGAPVQPEVIGRKPGEEAGA